MQNFDEKTLRTIAGLSHQYPKLLKYYEEFHASLKLFASRHLTTMAISDLVNKTSFEVSLVGATLRFELKAALNDTEPVGVITAYEPRSGTQGDYKVDSLLFDKSGMSTLSSPEGNAVDFVYVAEEVVSEIFRKLLIGRTQPD